MFLLEIIYLKNLERMITMYYFTNDYSEGAHPKIMEKLCATNMEQTNTYGTDYYSSKAKELIKKACGRKDIDVHLLVGGTQTNLTIICAALRPHQGVFSTVLSHINTHEAGAIERTGHKVLSLPTLDGKVTAKQIEDNYLQYKNDPNCAHWVQPKMVYISQPTEIGSLYHKEELENLYAVCQKYGLYLFIDGARLGYGLAANDNNLGLPDIARLCDVFYIGGTKCGALFGEAVVIINPLLQEDFFSISKQSGAILAKGRLLGIQFETLFTDNLYENICRHGINMAMEIKNALENKKLPMVSESTTNQQFPIFPNSMLKKLSEKYIFAPWEIINADNTAVRICTGWATDDAQVISLIRDIKTL